VDLDFTSLHYIRALEMKHGLSTSQDEAFVWLSLSASYDHTLPRAS
jgi:hypothetical protein